MTATALADLKSRLAEVVHLHGAASVLLWDRETKMPPGGSETRAEQVALLERLAHQRMVDPELGRLIESVERESVDVEPESDDARLLVWARRDFEKSVRVPVELAEKMARCASLGQGAWLEARAASDFSRFREALAEHIELRHRYAACFPDAAHPYDALLDDYEPGLTVAELKPLLGALADRLAPIVAAAARHDTPGALVGDFPVEAQRPVVMAILRDLGFDERTWRLDEAAHPFCRSPGPGDYRITTRYTENDLTSAMYSALHEFGHGLYDAGVDRRFAGTPLHDPVSLGIHESQSRLWENVVGRGRPFSSWLLGRLRELLGGFADVDEDAFFRRLNFVEPSLIRTEADETTYNLHIVLRFDLELALMEGRLGVDEVPAAWAEGMERLLGVTVPDDARGALQDVHWSIGAMGYFPTYTLGNLIAVQLWERIRVDIADIDALLARGDFAPLREWLRVNIHSHGRKLMPRELLRRATGQELSAEPFLAYLEGKLTDAGALSGTRAGSMPATS